MRWKQVWQQDKEWRQEWRKLGFGERRRLTKLARSGRPINDPDDLQLVAPYLRAMLRWPPPRWDRFMPWIIAFVVVGNVFTVTFYASGGRWGWVTYRLASLFIFAGIVLWWWRLRTRLRSTAQANEIPIA